MAGKVFVSGGSGYIAGFLIRQLIAEGWTVHTSIRDLARESAVRASLTVDDSRLKFFAADLMSDAGWAEAMSGCSHVAHVASPLPSNAPKSDDELIVPARDGALRALKAAKAAGVKRFVMTSSMAAIAYGHGRGKACSPKPIGPIPPVRTPMPMSGPRLSPNVPRAIGWRPKAATWNS